MNARVLVLALLALLATGGTVMLAKVWLANQRIEATLVPAPSVVEQRQILVARNDLPAGQFIDQSQIFWQPWPEDAIAETYYNDDEFKIDALYGAVVRRGISAGEPITRGRVLKPGDRGFLAAVLRPGYRAVSVSINARSGVSGLVFPGDRVDVILSHTVVQETVDRSVERRVGETVLTNVRILAIDQRVDDQSGQPKIAKTATLEVTPKIAEALVVIQEVGRLSLSLRSLAKNDEELGVLSRSGEVLGDPEPRRGVTYTFDSDVSRVVSLSPESDRDSVQVIRGSRTQALSFEKEE